MLASFLSRAAVISAVFATSALSQDSTDCNCRSARQRTPSGFEQRSSGGFSVIQSRPAGAFRNNIGFGYGANAFYAFRLDTKGYLSLRADAGVLGYGSEHFQVPLSPTIGGRIQVKVSTTNYIVPLSIGPQLAWPTGKFRPYVNAGFGTQIFFTDSNVEGSDDSWEFANTTNQSDWTRSWVAGGGVYMPVYDGRPKVSIDLGLQYHNGGRAQYLKPGSIKDLPNSQIQITPMESDTHMMLVRLGVRIAI